MTRVMFLAVRHGYTRFMYRVILLLHILAATIWTGGHLILATRILPRALVLRSASMIRDFESRFEAIGIAALVFQVASGLWLASRVLPPALWFGGGSVASKMIMVKLACLGLTAAFAIDARLRVIPALRDDRLGSIAYHITAVTLLGIGFVIAGVGFRTGGWGL
jgi:putative copper export protein